MKSLPNTVDMQNICRKVIWFQDADKSLADPVKLIAYAMTYGSFADMNQIRSHIGDMEFIKAMDSTPPGVIDPRSWAYWNAIMGRFPAPPMPVRRFD